MFRLLSEDSCVIAARTLLLNHGPFDQGNICNRDLSSGALMSSLTEIALHSSSGIRDVWGYTSRGFEVVRSGTGMDSGGGIVSDLSAHDSPNMA